MITTTNGLPSPPSATSFDADVNCPVCGYNLSGSVSDRCSECGYSLVDMGSPVSRIPWVHRKELGRFRAYWRTMWMVIKQPRRFREESARRVAYRDARLFQLVTVLHLYLPFLVYTLAIYLWGPPQFAPKPMPGTMQFFMPTGPTQMELAFEEVWPVALLHVCFLLYLIAATGVPSYWFHPKGLSTRMQNTGIAMSYYLCAPMAIAGVPIVAALDTLGFGHLHFLGTGRQSVTSEQWTILLIAMGGAALLAVVVWWVNLLRVAGCVMPRARGRRIGLAVLAPGAWVVLAGLILVVLPSAVYYVLIVMASLG